MHAAPSSSSGHQMRIQGPKNQARESGLRASDGAGVRGRPPMLNRQVCFNLRWSIRPCGYGRGPSSILRRQACKTANTAA